MEAAIVLRVVLSLLLSLALVLNAIFLVFGFRHQIGTRLCSLLLRSQTVIDSLMMLANLINIQYFALLPVPGQWLLDSLWLAYCKLAYSEILHWSLVSMSVYNLVCLAIERCCCLCAHQWYQQHQRLLIVTFSGVVLASPFIVEVPYCLLVTVYKTTNETGPASIKQCHYTSDNESVLKGFGAAYAILFWVLPTVVSVALYLIIMRKIRSSQAQRMASASGRAGKLNGAAKRLTLMTCITSGAFVLLFAMDAISYLLYCAGVKVEKRGIIDSVDSFLLALNSAVNPLLYLVFMPKFRSFVGCAHLRKRSCVVDGGDTGQQKQTRSHTAAAADYAAGEASSSS